MRKFNVINKNITFDNVDKCKQETEKLIIDPNYIHGEKNPIIKITTEEELKTHIYPRIEYFNKNRSKISNKISKDNIFKYDIDKILTNKKLKIYDNTNKISTYNTIDYIFNNFNTAVFVQILHNKIYTFVLLNNYKSHLNMLKYIKTDPKKYKNIDDFINKVNQIHYNNYKLIKKEEDDIYFNNCSISLMQSNNNNNNSASYLWLYIQLYDLLNNLLKNKKINDIEFIFNYKDMHLLTKDGQSNPHYNIIGNLTIPLDKKYNTFIPILNVGSSINFADIPVPTYDDWEICTNKIFLGSCRTQYYNILDNINTDYDNKIPTAIFRGSATGCGVTIKNNPRLKVAYLSKKYYNHPKYGKDNKDGIYLDAQIVSYKYKVKKHYSENYINYINPKKLNLKLGKKLNLSEITNYKYIISIEGNIAAFRLTLELAYNSVILLVKSEFYIWHQPLLKPWVHYVPVKHDLSDLMDKIEWCRNNDKKCKIIAKNAVEFFKKYIQKESIYDYMEMILNY